MCSHAVCLTSVALNALPFQTSQHSDKLECSSWKSSSSAQVSLPVISPSVSAAPGVTSQSLPHPFTIDCRKLRATASSSGRHMLNGDAAWSCSLNKPAINPQPPHSTYSGDKHTHITSNIQTSFTCLNSCLTLQLFLLLFVVNARHFG